MGDGPGLAEKVAAAGVVGAGGGGFPTAVKLQNQVDTVIVNGAECEPLVRADQELMARHPGEIVNALRVLRQATGAARGVIALKEKYRPAVEALRASLDRSGMDGITLHTLDDVYPIGDEHLLVEAVTGRVIGPGGLPVDAGTVVLNAETVYNVYQALQGRPVTEKWVSVAGAVARPLTVLVPLGVPFKRLISLAGPLTGDFVLLAGGPCMGRVAGPHEPVTKTTKGLLVLPAQHPLARRYQNGPAVKRDLVVCMQCRQCTDLCPRHLLGHPLEPHRVMRAMAYNLTDVGSVRQASLCSECGVCDLYACPFGLSPRRVNQLIKRELTRQGGRTEQGRKGPVHPGRRLRQVPAARLVARLGLAPYNHPAPWQEADWAPREVVLPLKQHAGAAALPVVETGETVLRGQVVALPPSGALGARLHASIGGVVTAVTPALVIRATTGGER